MSSTKSEASGQSDRLALYRARAESARREATRAGAEARDSYLFLADQWEQLAQLAQEHPSPHSFR